MVDHDPEVLILAACGYSVDRIAQEVPILEQLPGFESLRCRQADEIYICDGSAYFNRSGPRLVDTLELLAHILHPHVHAMRDSLTAALRLSRAN